MSRRKNKKLILDLLSNHPWPEIQAGLTRFNFNESINHLFTSICSLDPQCKWNGVRSFGYLVPQMMAAEPESARVVMRRFLWSLNDESGGIGWGAPEALAEIMAQDESLYSEYCHMVISYMRGDGPELLQDGNYLELPALQQGLLWGVARLLKVHKEDMLKRGIEEDLSHYFSSQDNIVQGYAALCASMCSDENLLDALEPLLGNTFPFSVYWDYTFREMRVCDLAAEAVDALKIVNEQGLAAAEM